MKRHDQSPSPFIEIKKLYFKNKLLKQFSYIQPTPMFTLDKLNLADLRLLFLAVNFKVNLGESLRRRIFEYTASVTKVDLSSDK